MNACMYEWEVWRWSDVTCGRIPRVIVSGISRAMLMCFIIVCIAHYIRSSLKQPQQIFLRLPLSATAIHLILRRRRLLPTPIHTQTRKPIHHIITHHPTITPILVPKHPHQILHPASCCRASHTRTRHPLRRTR